MIDDVNNTILNADIGLFDIRHHVDPEGTVPVALDPDPTPLTIIRAILGDEVGFDCEKGVVRYH